ncbi:MAG: hydrogenase small subunit [Firmicutes bacterium]|nr:hydrogenase small subunit [Bacillota bacterium]
MATVDQFQNFCQLNKNRPDFGRRLVENYGGKLATVPKPPLLWFEANACSGDSISTLNSVNPDLGQILCSLVEVRFWNTLMPEQSKQAQQRLFETAEEGGYILIVEGAIATAGRGRYTIPFKTGDYYFTSEELIQYLAPKAKFIVAAGTCATFGGPSAARPNPSGSKGVWEVIQNRPVINVSGCPINPDWLTGTLFYLLLFGLPEVDRYQRPTLFYGQTVHSICQRRSYFDTNSFAAGLGDLECMFSLGCMGPVTGADCPYRLWNDHLNWPVKASTPCIGCTKSGFPDKSTPFYTPLPEKIPQSSSRRRLDKERRPE